MTRPDHTLPPAGNLCTGNHTAYAGALNPLTVQPGQFAHLPQQATYPEL